MQFLIGLLHGIFAIPLFIMSFFGKHLFNHRWVVYNLEHAGHWYDFGFLLGAGVLFGGSRRAKWRRR